MAVTSAAHTRLTNPPRLVVAAATQDHAVQLRRIVQAEQPALHAAAGGEFTHHRRQVAAHALHSAGCIQFREEADEHALSLPTAALNGKSGCIFMAEMSGTASLDL